MRIALVGCVKAKLDRPAPAADLYTSTLFTGRRRWVEQTCEQWWILSALHGLVAPDTVLDPYDVTLTNQPVARRRAWAQQVLGDLAAVTDLSGATVEIHAGADYRDHGLASGLVTAGATVEVPARGLGIGQQYALYNRGPG